MQSTFPQQRWVWWHVPDTSTLRRLRLGDCLDFKASLSFTERLSHKTKQSTMTKNHLTQMLPMAGLRIPVVLIHHPTAMMKQYDQGSL